MSWWIVLAAGFAIAACSRTESPQDCLDSSGSPGRPAMVALLEGNRLVRIALPGGAIETEGRLESGDPAKPVDERDSFRLKAPAGPALSATPDGRAVIALVRRPASRGDRLAVVDARTLRVRCSHPLPKGVRYNGVLLGRSGRFYALGNRRNGPRGDWDAVLTIGNARTGATRPTVTLRAGSKDWYVYWGALSGDERRLVVTYHGRDTTGGEWFDISRGLRVTAGPDIGRLHGAVAAAGRGFIGTTGSEVLRVDPNGGEAGRLRFPSTNHNHLMDFALDGRRRAYVSLCTRRPSIHRLDPAGAGRRVFGSAGVCGRPLAFHRNRHLLMDATPVSERGYPSYREPHLRLFDLGRPGSSRPIRSARGAIDAVAVP